VYVHQSHTYREDDVAKKAKKERKAAAKKQVATKAGDNNAA